MDLFPNPQVLRLRVWGWGWEVTEFRVWVSGYENLKLELKTLFQVILKLADL